MPLKTLLKTSKRVFGLKSKDFSDVFTRAQIPDYCKNLIIKNTNYGSFLLFLYQISRNFYPMITSCFINNSFCSPIFFSCTSKKMKIH